MTQAKRRYNRMVWWKQLIPRTLYTIERTEEGRYLVLWRHWLWRAYDVRRVPVYRHA